MGGSNGEALAMEIDFRELAVKNKSRRRARLFCGPRIVFFPVCCADYQQHGDSGRSTNFL